MLVNKPNNSITIPQDLFLMSSNWRRQMKCMFLLQNKCGSFNNVHFITLSLSHTHKSLSVCSNQISHSLWFTSNRSTVCCLCINWLMNIHKRLQYYGLKHMHTWRLYGHLHNYTQRRMTFLQIIVISDQMWSSYILVNKLKWKLDLYSRNH